MGCGQCEHECPVFDTAAIVVYKFGENRRATGFYASKAQKEDIVKRRNRSGADNAAGNSAESENGSATADKGDAEGNPAQSASPSNGFSF
jgi:hypothetical protein